jgi:hypothetical protein
MGIVVKQFGERVSILPISLEKPTESLPYGIALNT